MKTKPTETIQCSHCMRLSLIDMPEYAHESWCRKLPTNELLENIAKKLDDLSDHMGL